MMQPAVASQQYDSGTGPLERTLQHNDETLLARGPSEPKLFQLKPPPVDFPLALPTHLVCSQARLTRKLPL